MMPASDSSSQLIRQKTIVVTLFSGYAFARSHARSVISYLVLAEGIQRPCIEPKLTSEQLKHAFYDAQPERWRRRFTDANMKVSRQTAPQILHYFPEQESYAARNHEFDRARQQEHQQQQSKKKAKNGHQGTNGDVENDKKAMAIAVTLMTTRRVLFIPERITLGVNAVPSVQPESYQAQQAQ